MNMLSPLVEEADNMYDQVGYFSRGINITISNESSINEKHKDETMSSIS